MRECERILSSGSLYWHGVDCRGRPVLWARSGLIDEATLAREPEAMVRAVTTMLEALGKWGGSRVAPRFTYVEWTDGLDPSKFPLRQGFKLVRGCVAGMLRGGAARGAVFLVAPSTLVNRVMLRLVSPFLPAVLRAKIHLLRDVAALREALRRPADDDQADDDAAFLRLGHAHDDADHDEDGLRRGLGVALPDFAGGTVPHELPRRGDGTLDLPRMMLAVRRAARGHRRQRRARCRLRAAAAAERAAVAGGGGGSRVAHQGNV